MCLATQHSRPWTSHELTPKEKEIWMLFDRVDIAELLARDAFAKGAYMLGAEDREIMLK